MKQVTRLKIKLKWLKLTKPHLFEDYKVDLNIDRMKDIPKSLSQHRRYTDIGKFWSLKLSGMLLFIVILIAFYLNGSSPSDHPPTTVVEFSNSINLNNQEQWK